MGLVGLGTQRVFPAEETPGGHRHDAAVEIHLRAGRFDPLVDGTSQAGSAYPAALRSLPSPDDLALVQFQGPPLPAWLDLLRREGVVLFDYVPTYAYLARVPRAALGPVSSLDFVRAVVPYLPAFRVAPDLVFLPPASGNGAYIRLLLLGAPDRDPSLLAAAVARAAPRGVPADRGRHPRASLLELEIDRGDLAPLLPRLATVADLFWIEEVLPVATHNDQMKTVLQTGGTDTRLFAKGLTGAGQILGVADTGLDTAHCFFVDGGETVTFELIDPANPPAVPAVNPAHRKVLAYQYHAASNTTDGNGHGTHVTGTAAGDDFAHPAAGIDPGVDPFDGMGPASRVVFQDIQSGGGFLDVPSNLYGYYQAAFNTGARIHTNSWGSATNSYTSFSSQVDDFVWDHAEMLFLFSAGNSGPGSGTIEAPASAKNVISVGMVETPAGGDPNDLETDSSNGPTSDGRRKPEVVNVGGFPIRSADDGTACGIASFGGTSMATPGVAGGAALVRQYLVEGHYPFGYAGSGPPVTPSGALLKAMIINSAVNISGTNVDAPIPDNSQGWGRVLLDQSVFFPNDAQSLLILGDDDVFSTADGFPVAAGATDTYPVFNCRTDVPLKVTLVWADPPVAATSSQAWVNDLNLEVAAPDSTVYLGNAFSGGQSTVGGTPDDRNNVEQVLIPAGAAASGTYTVRVVPANVAVGPQPYALIVTGDVSAAPAPRLALVTTTTDGGCDGDSFLDENETLGIHYTLQNDGCGASPPVEVSLTTASPLPVTIQPASVFIGAVPDASSAVASFDVALGDTGGACGGEIPLRLVAQDTDGRRWEFPDVRPARLDPASGSRVALDDVESGDQSAVKDPSWQINSCMVSSSSQAWHMGQSDCTGIPQDASAQSLEFDIPLAPGELLSSVSFVHAFDGYSNASLADSVHLEVDHDRDGNYDGLASWNDSAAPKSMTLAGPFELSPFQVGVVSPVRFRFRFQSAANWVGGANNAAGWNVDDFGVELLRVADCDVNSSLPPGNVGDTLTVGPAGGGALLAWSPSSGAASYLVRRSDQPDLAGAVEFSTTDPSFLDPSIPDSGRALFYKVFAVSGCGVISAN